MSRSAFVHSTCRPIEARADDESTVRRNRLQREALFRSACPVRSGRLCAHSAQRTAHQRSHGISVTLQAVRALRRNGSCELKKRIEKLNHVELRRRHYVIFLLSVQVCMQADSRSKGMHNSTQRLTRHTPD